VLKLGPNRKSPHQLLFCNDKLVRKMILVRVLIQFDKNNFSLVPVLVRQKSDSFSSSSVVVQQIIAVLVLILLK
jgi:hypothetical protein